MTRSKVDKDLTHARRALEQARAQGATNLEPLEKALERALMRKDLTRAQHFGRA